MLVWNSWENQSHHHFIINEDHVCYFKKTFGATLFFLLKKKCILHTFTIKMIKKILHTYYYYFSRLQKEIPIRPVMMEKTSCIYILNKLLIIFHVMLLPTIKVSFNLIFFVLMYHYVL